MIIDSKELGAALKIIAPAIQENTILPVLENVKIEVSNNKCVVTGTNLNLTIIKEIECESKESFTDLLPYKEMLNICNVIGSQPLNILFTGTSINISSNAGSHVVDKRDTPDSFPVIESVAEEISGNVDADFLNYLQQSVACASKDTNQVIFNGININLGGGKMQIIGCDSMQLFSYSCDFEGTKNVIISAVFVRATKALMAGVLKIGDKFIQIENGITKIIGRLSENRYPDCKMFFEPYEYNLRLNRKELLFIINNALAAPADFHPIYIVFTENKINFSYKTYYNKTIEAEHNITIESITLNGEMLKNLLSLLTGEDVNISITEFNKAIHLDDENIQLILTPIFNTPVK